MLKDITIGQYFPGKSSIHKLDPRTKLVLLLFYIVAIFICKSFLSLGVCAVALVAFMLLSGVPVKMYLKSIKAILPIILVTTLLNVFYISGGTVLFEWKFIQISTKGLFSALFIAIRIVSLIMSSSVLTYTTTPTMLTDGIERLLSPLNALHVPVSSLAMMMTLALRFIPTLIEEIERISNAQKARGADIDSGNFVERVKALVPILVPLFISAFRRADELSFAMECRCYTGGKGRTRMKKMKFTLKDLLAALVVLCVFASTIILNRFWAVL